MALQYLQTSICREINRFSLSSTFFHLVETIMTVRSCRSKKYESLTRATTEEREESGPDSISTFLRRAAISYHAAIWWLWYCGFLHEINMLWKNIKERETPKQRQSGREWDRITGPVWVTRADTDPFISLSGAKEPNLQPRKVTGRKPDCGAMQTITDIRTNPRHKLCVFCLLSLMLWFLRRCSFPFWGFQLAKQKYVQWLKAVFTPFL